MFLNDTIKSGIKTHSLEFPNSEVCGFVIFSSNSLQVFRCRNLCKNEHRFSIDPFDFVKASELGEIRAVYHSQVSNPDFSSFDIINSNGHNLTYILYCLEKDSFKIYYPNSAENKYTGRKFEIGKNDCFSIIKDYYKNEQNIEIFDYERDKDWQKTNPGIFLEKYEKEGFIKLINGPIDDDKLKIMRKGDLLLFKSEKSEFPGHLGIYLGNDTVLHHTRKKDSCIDIFETGLRDRVSIVLRHKKIIEKQLISR